MDSWSDVPVKCSMSVGQESVVRPVLDDSVRHLYIPRQEIDRYQRLARGEAASGGESFLSASAGLTIGPGVRAHLFAYRLVATLEGPPVFALVFGGVAFPPVSLGPAGDCPYRD